MLFEKPSNVLVLVLGFASKQNIELAV